MTEKGAGQAKKTCVMDFVKSKGLNVSKEDIDKIIEATVEQFNKNDWK